MSEHCPFSNEGLEWLEQGELLVVECPLCHATRKAQRRGYGYVFAEHNRLDADPVPRRLWQCMNERWRIVEIRKDER